MHDVEIVAVENRQTTQLMKAALRTHRPNAGRKDVIGGEYLNILIIDEVVRIRSLVENRACVRQAIEGTRSPRRCEQSSVTEIADGSEVIVDVESSHSGEAGIEAHHHRCRVRSILGYGDPQNRIARRVEPTWVNAGVVGHIDLSDPASRSVEDADFPTRIPGKNSGDQPPVLVDRQSLRVADVAGEGSRRLEIPRTASIDRKK